MPSNYCTILLAIQLLGGIFMQDFINASIKVVTNVAEMPNELLKLMSPVKSKSNKSQNYGGFVDGDWYKVGNDMKRGLINFGKTK